MWHLTHRNRLDLLGNTSVSVADTASPEHVYHEFVVTESYLPAT